MYLHAAYDIGVNSRCKGIWHIYAADNRWTGDPHLMLEWRHCVMVSRAQCMTIHLCIAREMVIVTIHTVCWTEITALLHSWTTNLPSVKIVFTKKWLVCNFRKSVTCQIVGLL